MQSGQYEKLARILPVFVLASAACGARGTEESATQGADSTRGSTLDVTGADSENGSSTAATVTSGPPTSSGVSDSASSTDTTFGGMPHDGCRPLPVKRELTDVADGVGGFAIVSETTPGEEPWGLGTVLSTVGIAGDVNGDGFHDVIVGAPRGAGSISGRAYVVFGKTDTEIISLANVAQGIGGFSIEGVEDGDQIGASVSGAGDVNGDGLADLIVSSGAVESTAEVYVVFGKKSTSAVSRSTLDQGVGGFSILKDPFEAQVIDVRGGGDINGDGLDDVLLGAPVIDEVFGQPDKDRVYVVFGKKDTATVDLNDVRQGIGGFVVEHGENLELFGLSVDRLGDLNGDGLQDFVVGASFATTNNGPNSGRVYVIFGKADSEPISSTAIAAGMGGFVIDGENTMPSGWVDLIARGAGDVNADGIPDIVIGAPTHHGVEGGRIYIVLGKSDMEPVSLIDVAQGQGGFALDSSSNDYLGAAVGSAGDFNGDGYDDVIIGAFEWSLDEGTPEDFERGRALLIWGNKNTAPVTLAELNMGKGGFILRGAWRGSSAGAAVHGSGDVNADGFADVIIGAPGPDGVIQPEQSYVVFGGCET